MNISKSEKLSKNVSTIEHFKPKQVLQPGIFGYPEIYPVATLRQVSVASCTGTYGLRETKFSLQIGTLSATQPIAT